MSEDASEYRPKCSSDEACAACPSVLGAEHHNRFFSGVGIGRNVPLEEIGTCLFHLDIADQRGDHRFVDSPAPLFLDDLCREFREYHWWSNYRVPVAEHERMHARVSESESDRILIGRRWFTASDIDRISGCAERRNELAKRLVEVFRHRH